MDNGQLTIKKGDNILKQKSFAFALEIVKICRELQTEKEFILSKQLLRSGTAIGALVEEANQAESKTDFIHKLSIANKEANETQYWIRLLIDSGVINSSRGEALLKMGTELIKILKASIKTSKLKR
jgi:four helix bundle protein